MQEAKAKQEQQAKAKQDEQAKAIQEQALEAKEGENSDGKESKDANSTDTKNDIVDGQKKEGKGEETAVQKVEYPSVENVCGLKPIASFTPSTVPDAEFLFDHSKSFGDRLCDSYFSHGPSKEITKFTPKKIEAAPGPPKKTKVQFAIMSVGKLKEYLKGMGKDPSKCIEKHELITMAMAAQDDDVIKDEDVMPSDPLKGEADRRLYSALLTNLEVTNPLLKDLLDNHSVFMDAEKREEADRLALEAEAKAEAERKEKDMIAKAILAADAAEQDKNEAKLTSAQKKKKQEEREAKKAKQEEEEMIARKKKEREARIRDRRLVLVKNARGERKSTPLNFGDACRQVFELLLSEGRSLENLALFAEVLLPYACGEAWESSDSSAGVKNIPIGDLLDSLRISFYDNDKVQSQQKLVKQVCELMKEKRAETPEVLDLFGSFGESAAIEDSSADVFSPALSYKLLEMCGWDFSLTKAFVENDANLKSVEKALISDLETHGTSFDNIRPNMVEKEKQENLRLQVLGMAPYQCKTFLDMFPAQVVTVLDVEKLAEEKPSSVSTTKKILESKLKLIMSQSGNNVKIPDSVKAMLAKNETQVESSSTPSDGTSAEVAYQRTAFKYQKNVSAREAILVIFALFDRLLTEYTNVHDSELKSYCTNTARTKIILDVFSPLTIPVLLSILSFSLVPVLSFLEKVDKPDFDLKKEKESDVETFLFLSYVAQVVLKLLQLNFEEGKQAAATSKLLEKQTDAVNRRRGGVASRGRGGSARRGGIRDRYYPSASSGSSAADDADSSLNSYLSSMSAGSASRRPPPRASEWGSWGQGSQEEDFSGGSSSAGTDALIWPNENIGQHCTRSDTTQFFGSVLTYLVKKLIRFSASDVKEMESSKDVTSNEKGKQSDEAQGNAVSQEEGSEKSPVVVVESSQQEPKEVSESKAEQKEETFDKQDIIEQNAGEVQGGESNAGADDKGKEKGVQTGDNSSPVDVKEKNTTAVSKEFDFKIQFPDAVAEKFSLPDDVDVMEDGSSAINLIYQQIFSLALTIWKESFLELYPTEDIRILLLDNVLRSEGESCWKQPILKNSLDYFLRDTTSSELLPLRDIDPIDCQQRKVALLVSVIHICLKGDRSLVDGNASQINYELWGKCRQILQMVQKHVILSSLDKTLEPYVDTEIYTWLCDCVLQSSSAALSQFSLKKSSMDSQSWEDLRRSSVGQLLPFVLIGMILYNRFTAVYVNSRLSTLQDLVQALDRISETQTRQNLPNWYDSLLRQTAHLCGKFAYILVRGEKFQKTEGKLHTLLRSPLFKGGFSARMLESLAETVVDEEEGVEHMPLSASVGDTSDDVEGDFLQSLIDLTGDGEKFMALLEKYGGESEITRSFDNPLVKKVCRLFMACVIKQSGKAQECLEYISFASGESSSAGEEEKKSPPMWMTTLLKEGQELKNHFGQVQQGKRRELQLAEKQRRLDSGQKGSSSFSPGEDEIDIMDKEYPEASYENLLPAYIEKAEFLLQLTPSHVAEEPSLRFSSGRVPEVVQQVASVKEDSQEESEEETKDMSSIPGITAEILRLIKLVDFDLSEVVSAVRMRSSRCLSRFEGMKFFALMLQAFNPYPHCQYHILKWIPPSFRTNSVTSRHFLDSSDSVPRSIVSKCRSSFEDLLRCVFELLSAGAKGQLDYTLLVAAIDAFSLRFKKEEVPFLVSLDVMSILQSLFSSQEENGQLLLQSGATFPTAETGIAVSEKQEQKAKRLALKLFRLIVMHLCIISADSKESLPLLETTALGILLSELRNAFQSRQNTKFPVLRDNDCQQLLGQVVRFSGSAITVPRTLLGKRQELKVDEAVKVTKSLIEIKQVVTDIRRAREMGRSLAFYCDGCCADGMKQELDVEYKLRYRCNVCDDFDFCVKCVGSKPHQHNEFIMFQCGLAPAPPPEKSPNTVIPFKSKSRFCGGDWSLSFWVFLTSERSGPVLFFHGSKSSQAQMYPAVYLKSDSLNIEVQVTLTKSVAEDGVSFATASLMSSSPISVHTWTHVAVVLENDSLAIFLNAVEDVKLKLPAEHIYCGPPELFPFHIGSDGQAPVQGSESFMGSMSDMRYYSRALQKKEIDAMQRVGPNIDNSDPSLFEILLMLRNISDVTDQTSEGWKSLSAPRDVKFLMDILFDDTTTMRSQRVILALLSSILVEMDSEDDAVRSFVLSFLKSGLRIISSVLVPVTNMERRIHAKNAHHLHSLASEIVLVIRTMLASSKWSKFVWNIISDHMEQYGAKVGEMMSRLSLRQAKDFKLSLVKRESFVKCKNEAKEYEKTATELKLKEFEEKWQEIDKAEEDAKEAELKAKAAEDEKATKLAEVQKKKEEAIRKKEEYYISQAEKASKSRGKEKEKSEEKSAKEEIQQVKSGKLEGGEAEKANGKAEGKVEAVQASVAREEEPAVKEEEPAAKKEEEPAVKKEEEPAAKKEREPAAKKEEEPAAKKEEEPAVKKEEEPAVKKEEEPAVKKEEPAAKKEEEPAVKKDGSVEEIGKVLEMEAKEGEAQPKGEKVAENAGEKNDDVVVDDNAKMAQSNIEEASEESEKANVAEGGKAVEKSEESGIKEDNEKSDDAKAAAKAIEPKENSVAKDVKASELLSSSSDVPNIFDLFASSDEPSLPAQSAGADDKAAKEKAAAEAKKKEEEAKKREAEEAKRHRAEAVKKKRLEEASKRKVELEKKKKLEEEKKKQAEEERKKKEILRKRKEEEDAALKKIKQAFMLKEQQLRLEEENNDTVRGSVALELEGLEKLYSFFSTLGGHMEVVRVGGAVGISHRLTNDGKQSIGHVLAYRPTWQSAEVEGHPRGRYSSYIPVDNLRPIFEPDFSPEGLEDDQLFKCLGVYADVLRGSVITIAPHTIGEPDLFALNTKMRSLRSLLALTSKESIAKSVLGNDILLDSLLSLASRPFVPMSGAMTMSPLALQSELEKRSTRLRQWYLDSVRRARSKSAHSVSGKKKSVIVDELSAMSGHSAELCRRALRLNDWDFNFAACWLEDNAFNASLELDKEQKNFQSFAQSPKSDDVFFLDDEWAKSLADSTGLSQDWCLQAVQASGGNLDHALSWLLKSIPKLFKADAQKDPANESDKQPTKAALPDGVFLKAPRTLKKASGFQFGEVAEPSSAVFGGAGGWPKFGGNNYILSGTAFSGNHVAIQRVEKPVDPLKEVSLLGLRKVKMYLHEAELGLCIIFARQCILNIVSAVEENVPDSLLVAFHPARLVDFIKLVAFRANPANNFSKTRAAEKSPPAVAPEVELLSKFLVNIFKDPVYQNTAVDSFERNEKQRFLDLVVWDLSTMLKRAASRTFATTLASTPEGSVPPFYTDFQALVLPNIDFIEWFGDLLLSCHVPKPEYTVVKSKADFLPRKMSGASATHREIPLKKDELLYVVDYSKPSKLVVDSGAHRGIVAAERVTPVKISPFATFFSGFIAALGSPCIQIRMKMYEFITQILSEKLEDNALITVKNSSEKEGEEKECDTLPPLPCLWDIPLARLKELAVMKIAKESKYRGRHSTYLTRFVEFVASVMAAFKKYPPSSSHRSVRSTQKQKKSRKKTIDGQPGSVPAQVAAGGGKGLEDSDLMLALKLQQEQMLRPQERGVWRQQIGMCEEAMWEEEELSTDLDSSEYDPEYEHDEDFYELLDRSKLFEVGMRLEARDIKNPSLICVASITDKQGLYVRIHFDGWGESYDYWCQIDNKNIGPPGSADSMGVQLQKPPKYEVDVFDWAIYLNSINAETVPVEAFPYADIGPFTSSHNCYTPSEFSLLLHEAEKAAQAVQGGDKGKVSESDSWFLLEQFGLAGKANSSEPPSSAKEIDFGWDSASSEKSSLSISKDKLSSSGKVSEASDAASAVVKSPSAEIAAPSSPKAGGSAPPPEPPSGGSSVPVVAEGGFADAQVSFSSLPDLYNQEGFLTLQVQEVDTIEGTDRHSVVLSDGTYRTLALLDADCKDVQNMAFAIVTVSNIKIVIVNKLNVVSLRAEVVMPYPFSVGEECPILAVDEEGSMDGREDDLKQAIATLALMEQALKASHPPPAFSDAPASSSSESSSSGVPAPPPPPPASGSQTKAEAEAPPAPEDIKEGEVPRMACISNKRVVFCKEKLNKKITLSPNGRKITHAGGGWAMALVDKVLTHGVHYFEVVLLAGIWGSTFYGVLPPEEFSPRSCNGFGLINYRAVVRSNLANMSEVHYGEHLFDGDTLGMLVDVDGGKLWFFKNGKNLGLAFTDLPSTLSPLYGMQNAGDCLELKPEHLSIAGVPPSARLEDMSMLVAAMKSMHSIPTPFSDAFLRRAYDNYSTWFRQERKIHRTKVGRDAIFNSRPEVLQKFGDFEYGDTLIVPSQGIFDAGKTFEATLVGEHGNSLWFADKNGAWYLDDPKEIKKIRVSKRRGQPYEMKVLPIVEEVEEVVILPTTEEKADAPTKEEEPSGPPPFPRQYALALDMLQEIFGDRSIEQLQQALISCGGDIDSSLNLLFSMPPQPPAPVVKEEEKKEEEKKEEEKKEEEKKEEEKKEEEKKEEEKKEEEKEDERIDDKKEKGKEEEGRSEDNEGESKMEDLKDDKIVGSVDKGKAKLEEEESDASEVIEDVPSDVPSVFFVEPVENMEILSFEEFARVVADEKWTMSAFENIVRLLNSLTYGRPSNVSPAVFFEGVENSVHMFPGLTPSSVSARFSILLTFSEILETSLPLVCMSEGKGSENLCHQLSSARSLIFYWTKKEFWAKSVADTKHPHRVQEDEYTDPSTIELISVERQKAMRGAEDKDEQFANSLFSQLNQKLCAYQPHIFRQEFAGILDGGQKRCFRLQFKGEGVSDNGGPYREIFNHISDELQSGALPLFSHCRNYINHAGENRERWVPNPSASDLDLFCFLGQLIGIAHRGEIQMDLMLWSVVWKIICEQPLTPDDLEMVDVNSYKALLAIGALDEETFDEYFSDFVWNSENSCSKLPVQELVPGGNKKKVKFGELQEYVKKNIAFRLRESKSQIDNIKRGLSSVVPVDVLRLFTWKEVRISVPLSRTR